MTNNNHPLSPLKGALNELGTAGKAARRDLAAARKAARRDLDAAREAARRDLVAAREAARHQLRSLSTKARDSKVELETNITALEHKLEKGADKARDAALGKAREVAKTLQGFLTRHGLQKGTSSNVGAIMTDAVGTCGPDDTLHRAAQIMWEKDCGAVPVVSAEGKLVGVITDRDICMAGHFQGRPLATVSVGSAMSKALVTCRPEDAVGKVLDLMCEKQIRRVPVVSDGGTLVGILSLADIAAHPQCLAGAPASGAFAGRAAALGAAAAEAAHLRVSTVTTQSYERLGLALASISERRPTLRALNAAE